MKLKYLIVLSLAFLLILGSSTALADNNFEDTELNLAVLPDPFAEPVQDLLPRFEEETGISVEIDILPYDGLREALLADLAGQEGFYDVMAVDIVWIAEFAEAGWTVNLDSYIEEDEDEVEIEDLLPAAMDGLAYYEDSIYGLPIGAYYYLTSYRADHFEDLGLDEPKTIDDIYRKASELNRPEEDFYGFSTGYERGAPLVHDSLAYHYGFGGELFADFPEDLTPQLTSETAFTTYEFYKDMLEYAPPGAEGFDFYERREPYMSGNVGVISQWSSALAQFEDPDHVDEEVVGNNEYTYLPRLDEDQDPTVPFGGWTLSINSFSENEEAAWKFLKWLTSPEIQEEYVRKGGTPIRFSTLETIEEDPELAERFPFSSLIFEAEEEGYVNPEYRPRIIEWPEIEEVMGLYLSMYIAEDLGLEDALSTLNQEIEMIVD